MIRRWLPFDAETALIVALAAAVVAGAAGCSTVGVVRKERAWAVVQPTIAYQMALDNPQIVILDVRAAPEFDGSLGHLHGAISVPLEELRSKLSELLPYRKSTVLVYADVESDATAAARILSTAGFGYTIVVRGGIRAWIESGYQTVKAP